MQDEPGKGRSNKDVIHERKVLTKNNISSGNLVQGSNTFISSGLNYFWHEWGIGDHDFASHRHISTRWPISEELLIRRTLDDFYNPNETDILLNVVESPELVTGVQSLFRKINVPKVTGRAMVRAGSGWKILPKFQHTPWAKAWRNGVGLISGGFLYYSFGIAPLLSDMRKLSKATDTYRKQVDHALRTAGKAKSFHRRALGTFGTFGSDGAENPGNGYASSPLQGGYWGARVNPVITPVMTCTVRGIRDHKYETEFFQKLSNAIDRFGSVGPASFVWERIPFSFVLDWFVDMSGALNSLDNLLTGGHKKVESICVSKKWSCSVGIDKIQRQAGETTSHDGSEIAQVALSHYSRHRVQPGLWPGMNDRFGKKQGTILGALLSQKAATLKRLR
jgi:hypothetical protein